MGSTLQEEINFTDKKKHYNNQKQIVTLNQDKGVENIEIKLYLQQTEEYWGFSYREFINILEEARKTLLQVSKGET